MFLCSGVTNGYRRGAPRGQGAARTPLPGSLAVNEPELPLLPAIRRRRRRRSRATTLARLRVQRSAAQWISPLDDPASDPETG